MSINVPLVPNYVHTIDVYDTKNYTENHQKVTLPAQTGGGSLAGGVDEGSKQSGAGQHYVLQTVLVGLNRYIAYGNILLG